jgi:hypothetical protein
MLAIFMSRLLSVNYFAGGRGPSGAGFVEPPLPGFGDGSGVGDDGPSGLPDANVTLLMVSS